MPQLVKTRRIPHSRALRLLKPGWHKRCSIQRPGRFVRRIPRRRLPEIHMLQTIVIILVLLWLVGMVSSYTLGGVLHILLVIALILVIVRLVSGRSAV